MMAMHGTSDAATCRIFLRDGREVEVVCGGGCFAFVQQGADDGGKHPPEGADGCAAKASPRADRIKGGGAAPAEALPAAMCWAVPCNGDGAACGSASASAGAPAVCALVDTGPGAHGMVAAVDVMAVGAGAAHGRQTSGLAPTLPGCPEN